MGRQLPLGVQLSVHARFDNFHPGPNREAVAAVRRLAEGEGGLVYLHGCPGSGRSHLLQAACALAGTAVYLPLSVLPPEGAVFEGLEDSPLVCVDDLETVAGNAAAEGALFALFNAVRDQGGGLLFAAADRPEALGLGLPDLVSRLNWGLVYGLKRLDDAERIAALRCHAEARGLELPEEVGRYLLRRCPRDLASLCDLLDTLDLASLAAQRRLTVPFVREVLARRDPLQPPSASARRLRT